MAINFPNNPAVNDTFTVGGTTFTFTGVKWETSAVVDLSSDTTPSLGGDLDAGTNNINNVGIITATGLDINGDADISGNLSVQGTTTTIDTAVTSVDSLQIDGTVAIGTATGETNFLTTINGDLSLGEKNGVDNTYIDQKQNGSLEIINSGRQSSGGGVRINRHNNISGDTTYFRDLEVYDGKNNLLLLAEGSSGNLGIGTDNPETKLNIVGSTASASSNGGTLGIRQKGDTYNDGITLTSSHQNSARFWKDSDGKLHIFNTGTGINQFVLDNAGNTGIGTDNPVEPLHVLGDARVDGNLYLDSTKYLSAGGSGVNWGSVQINGGGGGGYEGYSIDGRAAFVHDGSTNMGLYDDVNDHWALKHSMQAVDSITILYAGNNAEKLRITGDGITSTVPFSDSIGPLRRLDIVSSSLDLTLSAASHAGRLIRMTSTNRTFTIPSGSFSSGDMITIFHVGTGNMTIAQGSSVTLYNSADGSTGNRTLSAKGMVTIVCTDGASNEFVISGSQLT